MSSLCVSVHVTMLMKSSLRISAEIFDGINGMRRKSTDVGANKQKKKLRFQKTLRNSTTDNGKRSQKKVHRCRGIDLLFHHVLLSFLTNFWVDCSKKINSLCISWPKCGHIGGFAICQILSRLVLPKKKSSNFFRAYLSQIRSKSQKKTFFIADLRVS